MSNNEELINLINELLTNHRFIGEIHPEYGIRKFETFNGVGVFSHETNGFDFSSNGVDLSFKVREDKEDIQIINQHRIKRNPNSYASDLLNQLTEVFREVAKRRNKTRLIIIFEIQGRLGSEPQNVRDWLERLGYQKTQDKNSEKWIKVHSI